MKIKNILLGFVSILLSLSSCGDKDENEIPGRQSDNIKLSTKVVTFDASSSTQEVTTEGDQWFIVSPIIVDKTDVDITQSAEIEGDWYTITKESKKIVIKVYENKSDKYRVIELPLQSGNYHDKLTITQSK